MPTVQDCLHQILNPPNPTVTPIPPLCSDSPQFIVTSNPSWGTYSGQNITPNGIILISAGNIGVNTFTYYTSIGTCPTQIVTFYTVNPSPTISVVGTSSLCSGETTSIVANGVATFTWSDGTNGPLLSSSPTISTNYTVTGFIPATGCFVKKNFPVSVLPRPFVLITGNMELCEGDSTILTASGASYYDWMSSFGPTISIKPEATSTYTLNYKDSIHNCTFKEEVTVYVSSCTGVSEEFFEIGSIVVSPNPTSGKINIASKTYSEVLIFDPLGNKVLSANLENGKSNFDLGELPNGVYFIRLECKNISKTIKLIKSD